MGVKNLFIVIIIFTLNSSVFSVDPNDPLIPFNKALAVDILPKSIIRNNIIDIFQTKTQLDNIADQIFSLFSRLSKLYSEDTDEEIHISSSDSSSEILEKIVYQLPSLERIKNSSLLNSTETKNSGTASTETEIRAQIKTLYEQFETKSLQLLQSLTTLPQDELIKLRKKTESERTISQTRIEKIWETVKENIQNIKTLTSHSFSADEQESKTKALALKAAQEKLRSSMGRLKQYYKELQRQKFMISMIEQAIESTSNVDGYTNDPFSSANPQVAAEQVGNKLVEKRLLRSPQFKGFEDSSGMSISSDATLKTGQQIYAKYSVEYIPASGLTKKGILKVLLKSQDGATKMWRCSTVFLDGDKIIEFE